MDTFTVGYFVGNPPAIPSTQARAGADPPGTRRAGFSRDQLCGAAALHNRDYDADYPSAARAFKDAMAQVDAVLFVTPEYNRSIPGALKNAIDWASRPYGQNALTRKPSAVIGASMGRIGTAVGQQHLRSILSFCNSPQMSSREAGSREQFPRMFFSAHLPPDTSQEDKNALLAQLTTDRGQIEEGSNPFKSKARSGST